MDSAVPHFTNPTEEIAYWRELASDYKKRYEETKDELDEFQLNSRELEAELEAQLEQAENRNKEFKITNNKLQFECDSLREKWEKCQKDYGNQITDLQKELNHIRLMKDDLMKYIRELEQSNDDLERAKRATLVSLEDFELRLNQAIERNAFLESELDEKEALVVAVQRLKDESRDLHYELQVRKRSGSGQSMPDNDKCKNLLIDSNKLTSEMETQTIPGSPLRVNSHISPALMPSARISALNIVGDLLRKVGALESKLASCRSVVKEQPARNYQVKPSPLNNNPSSGYIGSSLTCMSNLPRSSSCPGSKDPNSTWGRPKQ